METLESLRPYELAEVLTIIGLVLGFALALAVFVGLFTGRIVSDPVKRNWLMGAVMSIAIALPLDIVAILGYGGLLPLLISAAVIFVVTMVTWSARIMDVANKLAFGQAAIIVFLVNWLVLTKRYLI